MNEIVNDPSLIFLLSKMIKFTKFFILLIIISACNSKGQEKKKKEKNQIFRLPQQDNYYMEFAFAFAILLFLSFYAWGKKRNEHIASNLFLEVRDVMFSNFALVGNNTTIHVYKV